MPPTVLIAEPDGFTDSALLLLKEEADVDMRACTRSELRDALERYDAVWFRLGHRIDTHLVGGGVRCRVLATPVTGLDHIDLDACERAGIRVVSLRGETELLRDVRGTAELTIGLMFALLRRVVPAVEHVSAGGWNRDAFRGNELYRRTAGIVGYGRLGRIVAEYLLALGMSVLAYDPFVDDTVASGVELSDGLGELASRSDVVTIHARYDGTTHHLVDGAILAAMKPTAVLVNTARGGIVDGSALLDALHGRRIAGAALDVVEGEPDVSEAHPLVHYARTHDNLVITPHIGGNTWESVEKTERFLAERVLQALRETASPR